MTYGCGDYAAMGFYITPAFGRGFYLIFKMSVGYVESDLACKS